MPVVNSTSPMNVMTALEAMRSKRNAYKWLTNTHVRLMREFGYIPLRELMNMPIPTLFMICDELKSQLEEEKKYMEKERRKAKQRKR